MAFVGFTPKLPGIFACLYVVAKTDYFRVVPQKKQTSSHQSRNFFLPKCDAYGTQS